MAGIHVTFGFYLFFCLLIILLTMKLKFGEWKFLLSGFLLIGISASMVALNSNLRLVVQRFLDPANPEYQAAKQVTSALEIWLLVFTGGILGIGVNIISTYIYNNSSKPV